jgi:hypothetical protein
VTGEYYDAGGKFICPACRDDTESQAGGRRRLLTATGFGIAAAVLGALLWFGVRRITGYEIGLIAIVVGLMVGFAVRIGAKGRGGARYQALAVFLTYSGIALNYAPDIYTGITEAAADDVQVASAGATPLADEKAVGDVNQAQEPKAQEMGMSGAFVGLAMLAMLVMALAYAAPVLGGFENVIGLLIIGFALYEAWKLNRRVSIDGPYRTAAAPPAQADVG